MIKEHERKYNATNAKIDIWERPWMKEAHDDLYDREDRFFAVVIKGLLAWLNENIMMYNKPIKHFIYNTGSTAIYIENNGYDFNIKETTGEDYIYMERPRCIVEMSDTSIDVGELTQPNIQVTYERKASDANEIRGYTAEMRRVPVEISINLHYVLSNFNESIVLTEELISKILFQKYFNVTYLGQVLQCSIEFPDNFKIEHNKIDMASMTDQREVNIDISLKLCTNYPAINERTEVRNDKVIAMFDNNTYIYRNGQPSDMDVRHVE